ERSRAAPHRPAPLRALRKDGDPGAGRTHPRRAAGRLAGGQLLAGRGDEGHLGPGKLAHAMLSRTANEVYWMARHIERAENTARMLDVTYRMSLLPYKVTEPGLAWAEPWAVPLITTGQATDYYARYEWLSAENVLRFMVLDATNPSSIFSCIRAARES